MVHKARSIFLNAHQRGLSALVGEHRCFRLMTRASERRAAVLPSTRTHGRSSRNERYSEKPSWPFRILISARRASSPKLKFNLQRNEHHRSSCEKVSVAEPARNRGGFLEGTMSAEKFVDVARYRAGSLVKSTHDRVPTRPRGFGAGEARVVVLVEVWGGEGTGIESGYRLSINRN